MDHGGGGDHIYIYICDLWDLYIYVYIERPFREVIRYFLFHYQNPQMSIDNLPSPETSSFRFASTQRKATNARHIEESSKNSAQV